MPRQNHQIVYYAIFLILHSLKPSMVPSLHSKFLLSAQSNNYCQLDDAIDSKDKPKLRWCGNCREDKAADDFLLLGTQYKKKQRGTYAKMCCKCRNHKNKSRKTTSLNVLKQVTINELLNEFEKDASENR